MSDTGKLLAELFESYLTWRRACNNSEATVQGERFNGRRFLLWLCRSQQITTPDRLYKKHLEDWQKYLAMRLTEKGRPLNPRSINKTIEACRSFLRYLALHDYVPKNLWEMLRYVKTPQHLPTSVLTHGEMRKLLSRMPLRTTLDYRNRAVMELLYTSGIRAGELQGLNLEDVDFNNATMLVTGKGDKQRIVPIGRTALRYLESYLTAVRPFLLKNPKEKAIFLTIGGKRFPYHRLRAIVKVCAAAAGLPDNITAHTFRRSCTTELIRGGAGLYQVKELLGHSHLDTLTPYTKLTITDLKKTHEKCHPRERDDQP